MMTTTLRKSALAAVVVGERGVVHHLEEHVEEIGVGLLDLVEEEHGVRRSWRTASVRRPPRSKPT
jgi:hypothetical protein